MRRDGDDWIINGEKKWIGNGSIADVVVVWARDTGDGQIKGFLVENCTSRKQFGKPLVSFQLVQDKLVRMLSDVTAMQLYCLRLARLIESGHMSDTIAALAKLNNTRRAREVLSHARELLGGNGILLDYHVMRHMADIEALCTFEEQPTSRR